jgi:hypothetical protein
VGDALAFKAAGVVEVLQGLAGGRPGGADAAFAAVGLAGGDLALQARSQELFVGPGRLTGALGPARDLLAQRGAFRAWVRNASSALTSAVVLLGPASDRLLADRVVHRQVPLLDLVNGGLSGHE